MSVGNGECSEGLCSNDLSGVESDGVCCLEACGECGGAGCNSREGGRENCCRGSIEDSGVLCSVSGMAPCIVDVEVEESFCDNGIPGIQGDGVCCSSQCGACGGSGCNRRPGGTEECCKSTIVDSGTQCSSSGTAPCIYTEVEESFCDNGIPGIQGSGVCCSSQCGTCGGSRCSSRPGGADECCRGTIIETGTPCGLSGSAPCVSTEVVDSFCDNDIPGIQGDGVCCSRQCGTCGGPGCGGRPGGADQCCRSTIVEAGTPCSDNNAPCVFSGDGPCDPNPCLNGGLCSVDPGGGHVCSCASNFRGMECQTDTSSLTEFYIELEYTGSDADWTDSRKATFEAAARRWEEVVTHQPCGGDGGFPDGRLLISAELVEMDGPGNVAGRAGPYSVRFGCPTISTSGGMVFDRQDIGGIEDRNILDGLVEHEMGHVIGVGTLWGDCSTCFEDGDPTWKCPQTIEAYNDLLGDPTGTEDEIVETNFDVGTRCVHWDDQNIFGDELMTGIMALTPMPLSKITVASLDDTGYVMDPSKADAYTLPAMRVGGAGFDPADAVLLNETAVNNIVEAVGENGEVVEIESVTVQFAL